MQCSIADDNSRLACQQRISSSVAGDALAALDEPRMKFAMIARGKSGQGAGPYLQRQRKLARHDPLYRLDEEIAFRLYHAALDDSHIVRGMYADRLCSDDPAMIIVRVHQMDCGAGHQLPCVKDGLMYLSTIHTRTAIFRQKRRMNVQNSAFEGRQGFRPQPSQITRENNQFRAGIHKSRMEPFVSFGFDSFRRNAQGGDIARSGIIEHRDIQAIAHQKGNGRIKLACNNRLRDCAKG